MFDASYYCDPSNMCNNSAFVIFGFEIVYLLGLFFVLKTKYWQVFAGNKKFLFCNDISAPMLFVLEKGNVIVLAPILLALALLRIGFLRAPCIVLLTDIKPYFALLMIYYVGRQYWKGFAVFTAMAGLIFIISGLALDNHSLGFFTNLFNFSHKDGLFLL